MENECTAWLNEVREIFPKLNRKIISADYKKIARKSLGYVKTKIEQKFNFDPESLILGKNHKMTSSHD